MKRHVALTGFMGCGKSTTGKHLARKLDVPFVDVDDVIAERHGAIEAIFESEGESTFRTYEYEAVRDILQGPGGIVALGGGALTHDCTNELLERDAWRVFIDLSPERIASRLRRSKNVRPLLGRTASLERICALHAQRLPRYAGADLVVAADGLSRAEIVERIVAWIERSAIRFS